MNYSDFKAQIVDIIRESEAPGTKVRIHKVSKNNGLVLDGLTILKPGHNISPTIYLEKYYRHFANGQIPIEEVVEEIRREHRAHDICSYLDPEQFGDFSKLKACIYPRLVNYSRNRTFLATAPHRRFLDLAVIYYLEIRDKPIGDATVILQDFEAVQWGVDEEELFRLSMANVHRDKPVETIPMIRLLEELSGIPCPDGEAANALRQKMRVISNAERLYGAVCLLEPESFRGTAEELGQDLFIIPSSIHEVIVLPVDWGYTRFELEKMVIEVNETQVLDHEVLSDHVYRYSLREGKVVY